MTITMTNACGGCRKPINRDTRGGCQYLSVQPMDSPTPSLSAWLCPDCSGKVISSLRIGLEMGLELLLPDSMHADPVDFKE
jgi:hypothetical protein